jgi:hypothetical protein
MLVPPTIRTPAKNPKSQPKSPTTAKSKKAKFEPLEHSVYYGRQRLGRYARVGPKKYASYDADDRLLGEFKSRKEAFLAVGQNSQCGRL